MLKKCILFFILILLASNVFCFKLEDNHTFIDDGNRKIVVTKPFKRIISLYPAHTENICALNGEDRLIGISRSDTYPPYILTKKKFSYHFGVERFVAANPDLIIIRPMIDRGYPSLIKQLEKQNIKVVSIQATSLSSMFNYWKILGMLIGDINRANDMIEDFKKGISIFKNINSKINKKKRVYFESIHKKIKTFAKNSIPIFVLKSAGSINIAQDAVSIHHSNIAGYGKERLLLKANKIDVFISQYGRMNRIKVEDIKREPGFNIIKAIKNNKVYLVHEEITSRPTMRLLLGIYEIGHILYPKYYTEKIKQRIVHILRKYYRNL